MTSLRGLYRPCSMVTPLAGEFSNFRQNLRVLGREAVLIEISDLMARMSILVGRSLRGATLRDLIVSVAWS